ncbi:hypothetical protein CEXT_148051 [Caerostris extrusa]|uniref:Uncharacterized protein n=1 Tax=Caerostris extrusa TaxID=172846 RepID=A0AAV4S5J2_CAEEX|nr:hypothetical protein CEXT_148051 [Caerostris extrusa]
MTTGFRTFKIPRGNFRWENRISNVPLFQVSLLLFLSQSSSSGFHFLSLSLPHDRFWYLFPKKIWRRVATLANFNTLVQVQIMSFPSLLKRLRRLGHSRSV